MADSDLYVDDMYVNLNKIYSRVNEALEDSDLNNIFSKLKDIKEATIVTGVGGSSVVACFLAKVLNKKNHIIATFKYPRDLKLMDLSGYKNVIAVSYSGRNIGVQASFDNNLNKYLLSGNKFENINDLQYVVKDEEYSFVSMAGTFIPLSIILMYYQNDINLIKDILTIRKEFKVDESLVYEILTSEKSITASMILESSLVEGGLVSPIIHEKYNYCHGRVMFNHYYHNSLIYFEDNSDLDKLFKDNLFKEFKNVIVIDKKYDDSVINDYYQTFISLLLCIEISKQQNKDLSMKNVPDVSEILYRYNGKM